MASTGIFYPEEGGPATATHRHRRRRLLDCRERSRCQPMPAKSLSKEKIVLSGPHRTGRRQQFGVAGDQGAGSHFPPGYFGPKAGPFRRIAQFRRAVDVTSMVSPDAASLHLLDWKRRGRSVAWRFPSPASGFRCATSRPLREQAQARTARRHQAQMRLRPRARDNRHKTRKDNDSDGLGEVRLWLPAEK